MWGWCRVFVADGFVYPECGDDSVGGVFYEVGVDSCLGEWGLFAEFADDVGYPLFVYEVGGDVMFFDCWWAGSTNACRFVGEVWCVIGGDSDCVVQWRVTATLKP